MHWLDLCTHTDGWLVVTGWTCVTCAIGRFDQFFMFGSDSKKPKEFKANHYLTNKMKILSGECGHGIWTLLCSSSHCHTYFNLPFISFSLCYGLWAHVALVRAHFVFTLCGFAAFKTSFYEIVNFLYFIFFFLLCTAQALIYCIDVVYSVQRWYKEMFELELFITMFFALHPKQTVRHKMWC